MRALFRCDASAVVGSGHLSRCLTLARALRGEGFTVDVATRHPTEHALEWIAREGCGAIVLTTDEPAAIREAAEGAALVVIDGYTFGAAFQKALRRADRIVCVVDDLATSPLEADVVLNGNLYAGGLSYEVEQGTELLCGPEYALVREEFIDARKQRAGRSADLKQRLLVTMGGADPTHETEKVVTALRMENGIADLHVSIVVGGANPRAEAIRTAVASALPATQVEVLVDVRAMGSLMAECDVAVTAAGGTCLELACVGVAAAAVVVADNQLAVGEALSAGALMDVLGRSAEVDAARIGSAIVRLFRERERARAMEVAQRRRVDGRGKERVAARLTQLVRGR